MHFEDSLSKDAMSLSESPRNAWVSSVIPLKNYFTINTSRAMSAKLLHLGLGRHKNYNRTVSPSLTCGDLLRFMVVLIFWIWVYIKSYAEWIILWRENYCIFLVECNWTVLRLLWTRRRYEQYKKRDRFLLRRKKFWHVKDMVNVKRSPSIIFVPKIFCVNSDIMQDKIIYKILFSDSFYAMRNYVNEFT